MHFYVGAGRGGRGVGEDCFDDVGAGYVVGAGGAGGVVGAVEGYGILWRWGR